MQGPITRPYLGLDSVEKVRSLAKRELMQIYIYSRLGIDNSNQSLINKVSFKTYPNFFEHVFTTLKFFIRCF